MGQGEKTDGLRKKNNARICSAYFATGKPP